MFIEIPASKKSLACRKPLHGVGINDADYLTQPIINGKRIRCLFYRAWHNMLNRCYNAKYKIKRPTYNGCTVCDEWLLFSSFKAWMIKQDWKGKALDKDILIQGNKIYSPETCVFVTQEINALLTNSKASRGNYPQGVSFDKKTGKYKANCYVNGKSNHIVYSDTPEAASEAYKAFKYKVIAKIANEQSEPLKSALLNYKIN